MNRRDPVVLSFRFSPEALKQFEALLEKSKSTDNAHLLRRALYVYELAVAKGEEGFKLKLKKGEEIIIFEIVEGEQIVVPIISTIPNYTLSEVNPRWLKFKNWFFRMFH